MSPHLRKMFQRFVLVILAVALTPSLNLSAADFLFPATCTAVWRKLMPHMLRSGFSPTPATNRDAGIMVFTYSNGASAYVPNSLVRTFTSEIPGPITTYQIFAIQQATGSIFEDDADKSKCRVTFVIDFLAYKTSFLQTGWLKLPSSGAMEQNLLLPLVDDLKVVAEIEAEKTAQAAEKAAIEHFDLAKYWVNMEDPQCPYRLLAITGLGLVRIPNCMRSIISH